MREKTIIFFWRGCVWIFFDDNIVLLFMVDSDGVCVYVCMYVCVCVCVCVCYSYF
jgi:hypothetical protein